MKRYFLPLLAVAGMITTARAASIKLVGDLLWAVEPPKCRFIVDGAIQNISQVGTTSGTLKLTLWASAAPFPSRGTAVSEEILGQLSGGYQMAGFTKKSPAFIPRRTGKLYFTLYVAEYMGTGWATRAYVPGKQLTLEDGLLLDGGTWKKPAKTIVAPLVLKKGAVLHIKTMAAASLSRLVKSMRSEVTHTITGAGKIKETGYLGKRTATFTRKTATASYLGKSVPVCEYIVTYKSSTARQPIGIKHTLFFFGPKTGVCRSVATDAAGSVTTWGTFTFTAAP